MAAALLFAMVSWLAPPNASSDPPSEPWSAPPVVPAPMDAWTWDGAELPDHPYYELSPERVAQFDRLAECESRQTWDINTGNGYSGGIQFHPRTWRAIGGQGQAWEASREEQIHRGDLLQSRYGWSQWPACSRRLRLVD